MELMIGKFVLLYLLLPLIGILLGAVMFFIAKKNQLLSNKKLIFYFLITCVILTLPALLGFIDYWFMPYIYIILQLCYFGFGWYSIQILENQFPEICDKPYYVEFLFLFVIMFISAALFSLVFNLCNELQYGLWACTCMLPFIFPSLFRKAYQTFMDIPLEVYKVWHYVTQQDNFSEEDFMGSHKITVVELELFKNATDNEPLNIKAKASEEMPFGVWFKIFINDYNKKSAENPIAYRDSTDSFGWIFYTLTSFLGRKKYIDPDLSFAKNKIKEHRVIIAKRTRYQADGTMADIETNKN